MAGCDVLLISCSRIIVSRMLTFLVLSPRYLKRRNYCVVLEGERTQRIVVGLEPSTCYGLLHTYYRDSSCSFCLPSMSLVNWDFIVVVAVVSA